MQRRQLQFSCTKLCVKGIMARKLDISIEVYEKREKLVDFKNGILYTSYGFMMLYCESV